MANFGNIEEVYADYNKASVLLQAISYDGTSTWGKGADKGFEAFLESAENMELYDIETDSEVYKEGIHILPELKNFISPENMFSSTYNHAKELLKTNKFLTFFGGEHSISIGIIKAFYEKYPDITILHFDAHADLRESYLGSKYNHACALHDASKNTNLVQIGIRSMDQSEKQYVNFNKCFLAENMHNSDDWINNSLELITNKVYITFDLDVLDPSIMPATGTPEPGGLNWNTILKYLRKVFSHFEVLGFDIVELAPMPYMKAPNFLAAKLYYKMVSYKYYG